MGGGGSVWCCVVVRVDAFRLSFWGTGAAINAGQMRQWERALVWVCRRELRCVALRAPSHRGTARESEAVVPPAGSDAIRCSRVLLSHTPVEARSY